MGHAPPALSARAAACYRPRRFKPPIEGQESIMSVLFELFYWLGYTPWDIGDMKPAEPLRRFIEGPQALRPGRALDLGCGMGRYTIYLAEHGWTAIGIDSVERALRVARRRAGERKVACAFVRGDVTRLAEAGIAGPFDLLLDSGCFHGMSDRDRLRYGEALTRVAAPDGQILVFAIGHRQLLPAPRGAERADIEESFPGWAIDWTAPDHDVPRPPPGGGTPMWYRLRRNASAVQRLAAAAETA